MVRLEGTESNRDAIGSKIELMESVATTGTVKRTVVKAICPRILAVSILEWDCRHRQWTLTTVRWPNGLIETWNEVDVNQNLVTLVEGSAICQEDCARMHLHGRLQLRRRCYGRRWHLRFCMSFQWNHLRWRVLCGIRSPANVKFHASATSMTMALYRWRTS